MELGGLKLWQWVLVVGVAVLTYNPTTGIPGLFGAILAWGVVIHIARFGVGWLRGFGSTDPAP